MKITTTTANPRGNPAFTLVEALISSGILVMLVMSIILCNLWGLSMSAREQIWLGSSDDSGKAIGKLYSDIRGAASNIVGSFGANGFVPVGFNTNQSGNALMVYPSTNASNWVLYYYNSTSNLLIRTNYTGNTNGDFGLVTANHITNDKPIFNLTDYLGNILTNPVATPAVQVYLAFTKLQDAQIEIAPGSPVDFYTVRTTITSRSRP
jgi:hypothetical protein